MLIWAGSEWALLPIGNEGANLQILDGKPTWVIPSGGVQFGFQEDFDKLNIKLDRLDSDKAEIVIEKEYGSLLNPNITSMSLLISTNFNPILVNSSENEIDLEDFSDEFGIGISFVSFNGLERDTKYYYRAIINDEFIDENVYSFKTPYALGENFQGGILAYVYQPYEDEFVEGQMHGFVVAESALTDTAAWGCEGIALPGMVTGGFAGTTAAQNQAIIDGCEEAGIAVKLCNDLTLNGYSDWLLPSKDLINNGIRKNEVLEKLSGIVDGYYWTCTPHSNNPAQSAWATHINNGSNIQADKSIEYHIIPVREF